MAESSLWSYMKGNLPGHWVRIENKVAEGTPDVNGCFTLDDASADVWIELKARDEWPVRAATPIKLSRFTNDQKQWLLDRAIAGGKAYLFVRIQREYFLFSAAHAYHVEQLTRKQWHQCALVHCKNRMDWDAFMRAIL